MGSPSKNICYSHLNTVVEILQIYDGKVPFRHYIKKYFAQHKKFGSKDRREISRICYTYFRAGKAFSTYPLRERILRSLKQNFGGITPEWQEIINELDLPDRKGLEVFPWRKQLSAQIEPQHFEASLAIQPDLFLRIRPGCVETVTQKLKNASIPFQIEGTAVRIANSQQIETVLKLNQEVVVQDLNSQQTGRFLELVKNSLKKRSKLSVYDCCAASGGKSILAWDILGPVRLTVSDIRPSMIANLKKRLQQAGITPYQAYVRDLTKESKSSVQYDLVIADLPCTGSGTWARTPEQLYFFEEKEIKRYASLQTSILQQVKHTVKPGGFLLYLTCSVFKEENEAQVALLLSNGFTLVEQRLLKGYFKKADTLFGALLSKTPAQNHQNS